MSNFGGFLQLSQLPTNLVKFGSFPAAESIGKISQLFAAASFPSSWENW